jgi:cell division protein FtsZ
LPPQLQPHEPKRSGFSMFGITIGASQPKKPLVQRQPAPSSMRLSPDRGAPVPPEAPSQLPAQQRAPQPKTRAEDAFGADDELEIPAFLRRQVN